MPDALESRRKSVALVTGATSGIGLAVARQLVREHHQIVLVARDAQALKRVAAELGDHDTKVYILAQDLSTSDAAVTVKAFLDLNDLAVDILVNNAGFGVHGSFVETSLDAELNMLQLQLHTLLGLTKALLPGMLLRGYGRILNVGSVYSFSPVPFQAVYSACKAFMLSFGLALDNEVRDRGVTVTCVCPGITRTAFRRRSGKPDKNKGMSADAVASIALRALFARRRVVVPGVVNYLFVIFARHVPIAVVPPIMRLINTFRGLVKRKH